MASHRTTMNPLQADWHSAELSLVCEDKCGNYFFRGELYDNCKQSLGYVVYKILGGSHPKGHLQDRLFEAVIQNRYGKNIYLQYGRSCTETKLTSYSDRVSCLGYIRVNRIFNHHDQPRLEMHQSQTSTGSAQFTLCNMRKQIVARIKQTACGLQIETMGEIQNESTNTKSLILSMAVGVAANNCYGMTPKEMVGIHEFTYEEKPDDNVLGSPSKMNVLPTGAPAYSGPLGFDQPLTVDTSCSPPSQLPQSRYEQFKLQVTPGSTFSPKQPFDGSDIDSPAKKCLDSSGESFSQSPTKWIDSPQKQTPKPAMKEKARPLLLEDKRIIGYIDRPTKLMDFYCSRNESRLGLKVFNQSIKGSLRNKLNQSYAHVRTPMDSRSYGDSSKATREDPCTDAGTQDRAEDSCDNIGSPSRLGTGQELGGHYATQSDAPRAIRDEEFSLDQYVGSDED